MKKYKQFSDGSITCESRGMSVPANKENRHYREFLNIKKQELVKITTVEEKDGWGEIKARRKRIRENSDGTQIPDNELLPKEKAQWRAYRQQGRNITNTFDKPENVEWPSSP